MKIYCFINEQIGSDYASFALAEDGTILAHHISSSVAWAKHDMGITTDNKHEDYRKHCPDGFELEWVDEPQNSQALNEVIKKNQEKLRATVPDSWKQVTP